MSGQEDFDVNSQNTVVNPPTNPMINQTTNTKIKGKKKMNISTNNKAERIILKGILNILIITQKGLKPSPK